MKKILAILFIVSSFVGLSQVPQKINYQGVARTPSGVALPNTPLTLAITISNTISTYSENHSVTSNSVGIFTLLIGGGTPTSGIFSTFDWSDPAFITVTINAGFGNQTFGPQPLVSVPYALYAERVKGSAALPTGTVTGQTLYWQNSPPKWIVDNNLTNDGNHVGIGLLPIGLTNKLHVVTGGGITNDRAAIFGYRQNADTNSAGVRGVAIGSTTGTGTLTFKPISGGNFIGFNGGTGSGVGTTGQGFSNTGDAVGIMGIGTSSSSTLGSGVSVGVYGTALGSLYRNSFAGVFDRGKVMINDSLYFPTTGNPGDILVLRNSLSAGWINPGSLGPWGRTAPNVFLNNINDEVQIGGSSATAKLQVATTSTYTGHDLAITSAGGGYALQVVKFAPTFSTAGLALFSNLNTGSTGTVLTIANTGSGPGAYIDIAGNNAIYAKSTGTVATIHGLNWNGSGPSVQGTKSATNGNAGLFEITYTASPSDALFATQSGKGAAVHAKLGPSVTGASNVALLLEDGHMRSIGATVSFSPVSTSSITAANVGNITIAPNNLCTDVSGSAKISFPPSTILQGGYIELIINFNKAYGINNPRIVVTPVGIGMVGYVTATTNSSITIKFENHGPPSGLMTNFSFNYFVIDN